MLCVALKITISGKPPLATSMRDQGSFCALISLHPVICHTVSSLTCLSRSVQTNTRWVFPLVITDRLSSTRLKCTSPLTLPHSPYSSLKVFPSERQIGFQIYHMRYYAAPTLQTTYVVNHPIWHFSLNVSLIFFYFQINSFYFRNNDCY